MGPGKQLELGLAKRRGRPRKKPGARRSAAHCVRPVLDRRHPQHVTLRVVQEVGWLRKRSAYRAFRRALVTVAARQAGFRVVHLSLQTGHVHLLCEAGDRMALARGLQGFQISAAKHLNREVTRRGERRRRGQVFADRYHVEAISSVRQARNALAYVLNNWRKHGADQRETGLFGGRIDPYSSGVWFAGWKERAPASLPDGYEPMTVAPAKTWLLARGYAREAPISMFEVPGPRR